VDGEEEEEGLDEESWEYYFDLFKKFQDGGYLTQFLPNIADCSDRTEIFIKEVNETLTNYELAQKNGTVESFELVQNISKVISNEFAWTYLKCHMTVYDGYIYYLQQAELYEEGGWMDWFQSFLQNMIGNILTINNLYNKVLIANDNEDT
jgi:hypothetical protein